MAKKTANSQKTILIVDDEQDIRDTLEVVCQKAGYKTVLAVSGDDALLKLKSVKPDLILMDIMMPGTPVKEVVKKIKSTKIAYISVVRMSDAERESLMQGGNIVDFIQKPFDVSELVKRLKKLLPSTIAHE